MGEGNEITTAQDLIDRVREIIDEMLDEPVHRGCIHEWVREGRMLVYRGVDASASLR